MLYNPEYARKLVTVRTDLVPSDVTQKIAKAVYQEDILKVVSHAQPERVLETQQIQESKNSYLPDEAIHQCVKIVNDRIHTSPELIQAPADPFRVQIITTDRLRPRSRKLIRAVSDTEDKFIARVFNTSDSEDTCLDYTVQMEQP